MAAVRLILYEGRKILYVRGDSIGGIECVLDRGVILGEKVKEEGAGAGEATFGGHLQRRNLPFQLLQHHLELLQGNGLLQVVGAVV